MATTQYTPVLVVSMRSLFPVEVKVSVSDFHHVCDNLVMSSLMCNNDNNSNDGVL